MECTPKGKAHRRYELDCKVNVVVANRSNWVLSVQALHGNQFDGHPLVSGIWHLVEMTRHSPERIFVNKSYNENGHSGSNEEHVAVAGRIPKIATKTSRILLNLRSVTESTIGYINSDELPERNLLKGKESNRINSLMARVCYNFPKAIDSFWLAGGNSYPLGLLNPSANQSDS